MKQQIILILMLIIGTALFASIESEARALNNWLNTPFSASALEAERDARLREWQNLVKGEFETTAQFEQRQRDAASRIAAIRKEYEQKIADARAAYDAHLFSMRARLQELLNSSRETIQVTGTLGKYDADTQKYTITIPERSFEIVVPLDKAPQVKDSFISYQLKVTRQLNIELGWDYLEARLEGALGAFASTDKAPRISQASVAQNFIPPNLSARVSFSEPSGNKMLDAEETAVISISIQNTGQGSGNMVEASFELLNAQGVSFARQLYFGEIKAGQTASKELQLIAGMDTRDQKEAELKIHFSEQNGFPPNDVVLKFDTKALLAPDIYVSDIGIENTNRSNRIQPGDQVEITARIHNRGQGTAKNVNAQVLLGEQVFHVGTGTPGFNLGEMKPGAYKDIKFTIAVARTASALDLRLDLTESRNQFSKRALPLDLALNKVERTAEQMIVTGISQQAQVSSAPALNIDVEMDIPARGKENKNRWGVIVGIENYRNVSSVSYARRDAEWMKEYFIRVLGIQAANLYMITDDVATLGRLKEVFGADGWLSQNAGKKDSEIYVYFSGHGVPTADGKQAYLLPYDGNPNYAANTAYELKQLFDNLGTIKAKSITVFLDSCFSGANRESEVILADARGVFIVPEASQTASHVSVFSAASGKQISSGYGDMQHGLFSYYLMKGLRGEADGNKDRKITQQELQDYLQENVGEQARRMGREQEPTLQSHDAQKVIVQW